MFKSFLILLLILVTSTSFAQDNNEISVLRDILGRNGLIFIIGGIFFGWAYFNSVKLFNWIEDQTIGTRDFILEKCELLHLEIKPNHITYGLLGVSFGLGLITFGLISAISNFTLGLVIGGIIAFIGWKAPKPIFNSMIEKRIKVYQTQMVDALQLLSNGLRAGLSVPQAIGMVVDELPNPVSQEFNTILQQTRIGVPLEEAFENLVNRVPTEDNQMFVSSVNILRETGGNLAEVFDTIAFVIRERVRLAQKIDTYVAQGKFQGMTIFAMPFVMGAMFAASDPASMAPLFNTIPGLILLFTAIGLDLLGGYVILKIIKIKV